ncbi:glycoside hydrolase superfamily [Terfezia claveryi]|nr:glycoside hydrolase superfamily [Terfezia claveryi]
MLSKMVIALAFVAVTVLQLVSAGPIDTRSLDKPGISYSPYTGTPGNTRCKTPAEVGNDIARLQAYSLVRLYGLDCDQVKNVLPHTRKYGMQLMVGIYDVNNMDMQCNMLSSIVNGNWKGIHSVMIGNEFILEGKKTAQQMVDLTKDARAKLRAKGFKGPVASVNVFYEVLQNPLLCQEQDIIAVNCHPFFDGKVPAKNAGAWVANMRKQVSAKCGGKYVMITETGWPTKGSTNGQCAPSKENQLTAVNSISSTCADGVVLFNAFNDVWKSPGAFNAEQYWGILS